MKTLQMLLWLTSMSFCLVFLLISAMSTFNKQAATSALEIQQFVEPACFLLACIGLSLTPIRVISHQVRYILAFGSCLLIGLYYVFIISMGDNYTNHPNSALFQMDMWVITTLVILIAYAIALFKADHAKASQADEESDEHVDPLLDPLFKSSVTKKAKSSNEEIELEMSGSPVSHSEKRWRRTT
ncbi:MAG: hypothetical protein ACF8OB_06275 [Phycisphaeraceae bacterium JB051]